MPIIVLFCGPPCSGKSHFSRLLKDSDLKEFARFEMDEIRISMGLKSHGSEDRRKAYARMHELAGRALKEGAPGVILDATYQPALQRHAIGSLCDQSGASVSVIECRNNPADAVGHFFKRSFEHGALDLSPERVWDLAHNYPYSGDEILTSGKSEDVVKRISQKLKQPYSRGNLENWISRAGVVTHGPELKKRRASPRLTERSRRKAFSLKLLWRGLFWGLCVGPGLVAFSILAKAAIDLLSPAWRATGLRGDAGDWIQAWGTVAVIFGGLLAVGEFVFRSKHARRVDLVTRAGNVPRFDLSDVSGGNFEIYRKYKNRIACDNDRFLIEPHPLWFLIPPSENAFDVHVEVAPSNPVDHELLKDRAARIGLDWEGFRRWRQEELRLQYYDAWSEVNVRALDVSFGDNCADVIVSGCNGSFANYFCTELSANLGLDGRFGFSVRELLEGPCWKPWESPKCRLDLQNLREASRTFEMLVSIQVALTTSDGYLVLTRRSDRVQSAAGGVGPSAGGFVKISDGPRLIATALRELEEEIGIVAKEIEGSTNTCFLGAAFSLLRGRDLNFYCHLHTSKTFDYVSRRSNSKAAKDRWEVAHLIPVPFSAVQDSGRLTPEFEQKLGDARHVRGLIFCLARSTEFRSRKMATTRAS